ncbi:MAG: two component transcriptional regulator, winged helix family [uncultured bacterium (gcode 4)]|uniref:Two component transcriptional regulator, winged helix family n=1 Tax=uncultured bacterium (gcode 4) TaxID=1234023 RepID=K2G2Z9_9BACT|nr:MAG: two component transcriptional regulator, winged helix family [uncultured bacterium (gcode 4)]
MPKILIIEDDKWILQSLELYFSQSGFEVILCDNGTDAMDCFRETLPDLIVLDINLPWKDGITIAWEIREIDNTPIIILSARWREEDKIMALDLWADDYVSKPFSPRELLARIKSVLKRVWILTNWNDGKVLIFNTIELDLKHFELRVSGVWIKATKTEFLLLKYMIEHKDEVILREKLMKEIMWYDNYLYDRTIDTHVKNLRKKLWEAMAIDTIRGVGYKVS